MNQSALLSTRDIGAAENGQLDARVQGAPRTREGFLCRWRAEGQRLKRLGALVDAGKLLDEVLGDAEALFEAEDNDVLTLTAAADESGYSADHLGRLVREGLVRNAGRKNAPKIRRADLPRKPSARLPRTRAGAKFVGATPTQIARAVVTSDREDPR
jgi:hypothetical protein